MRHLKTFQDYSANRKHCIFSGDTDFLMMGIGVHEIYVTLLQNVISIFFLFCFGRNFAGEFSRVIIRFSHSTVQTANGCKCCDADR